MWLENILYCTRNNNSIVWAPAALLLDICAIPVLGALDIATVCFNYVLRPIAQVAIATFSLCPQSVLNASGNFVAFTVPASMLCGMGYLGYSVLSNRSILDDAKFVASSLSSAFEPVLGNKVTLCALAVSFGAGVAITKFLSSDSGKGQARE